MLRALSSRPPHVSSGPVVQLLSEGSSDLSTGMSEDDTSPPTSCACAVHTSTHRTSRQLVPSSRGWGHAGCRAQHAAGMCSTSACGDRQWQSWCKCVHVRGWRQENTTQHMFLIGFTSRTSEVVSSDYVIVLLRIKRLIFMTFLPRVPSVISHHAR